MKKFYKALPLGPIHLNHYSREVFQKGKSYLVCVQRQRGIVGKSDMEIFRFGFQSCFSSTDHCKGDRISLSDLPLQFLPPGSFAQIQVRLQPTFEAACHLG